MDNGSQQRFESRRNNHEGVIANDEALITNA